MHTRSESRDDEISMADSDGSDGTTDASARPLLAKALQLAQRFDAGVRLVHVIVPAYAFVPEELKQRSKQLDDLLRTKRRRAAVDIATTTLSQYLSDVP
jgi:nucleotide-binding universal stress UspA family protein